MCSYQINSRVGDVVQLFAHEFKGWMLMAASTMLITCIFWLYADFIDATPNETRDED